MTEEDAITLIRAGGKARDSGLRSLYQAHAQRMLQFFAHKGLTPDDSKDVLQETFVKIVRGAESYSGDGAAKAWIWQIARNCLTDQLRKMASLRIHAVRELETAQANTARKAAEEAAETVDEGGVTVTRYPYVKPTSQNMKGGGSVTSGDEQWQLVEKTIAAPEPVNPLDSVENCVSLGLNNFRKEMPERAYAITLQMEGTSIEDIGNKIGRTAAATKQYLYECRKKIQPFIAHCTEMLEN